jgi:hypothetical protein
MKVIILLSPLIFLAACRSSSSKEQKVPAPDTSSVINNPASLPGNSDTLFITQNAAVYYRPDSAHIEQWKKKIGEEDFYTVVDDWSFYMSTSHEFLDSMKLDIKDVDDKKVLKFIKADQSATIIRLDTLQNYWGVYLFSPAKEPLYADIVSMDTEYHKYFPSAKK